MSNYNSFPELIDEAIVERARRYGSAGLADGIKSLDIPNDGCMEASVLPLDKNSRMAGTAITVETENGDNFPIHVAIYQGKPGYVLVIDGKGYTGCAYLGDLIGGAAKAVGIDGIVVDGMVRDRVGLEEMGLPVYSKGLMQRGPTKIGPGKINTKITCAGVEVCPGDLVVGDADGVTVVPCGMIEAVFEAADKKLSYEAKRRETIEEYEKCRLTGAPLPQLAPQWVKDMQEKQ